eukprot:GEZU01039320.1.p1 GENE.GEZU01039320.1~~GEZU01039320.1.p1  ORF type:complete len:794 (-),score=186.58 GEZU01039320.1:69-2450(-)
MTRTKNIDVVFVGNFAQDTIITNDGCTNHAMGGSVTYGPLAAASFCSSSSRDDEIGCTVRIISWIGDDITPENRKFIQERFENAPNIMIHRLQSSTDDSQEPNTTAAYKLEYDENNCRTLSLPQKGRPIGVDHVKRHIGSPDAVFFVPIAAEFDEDLIIQTIQHIKSQPSNNSSSSSNSVLKRRTRTTDNPGLQQQYLMCDYVVYILSCIFDILELTKTPVCVENDDDGSAEQNSDDALTIYGTRPKNRSNIPEQMSSSATTTELVEKFRQHSLVKTSSIQIGKDRLVEELRMLCYALTERIVTTAQTPPAGEITSDQDDERPGSVLLSIALAVSSSPPLISASVPPNLCDPKDFSLYLCQQLLAEIQEGTSSAAGSLTACLSLAGSLAAINAEDFNQSEQSDRVYDVTYRILTELKSTQPSVVRELIKFMLMHTTPKKGLDRADKIINSCLKYHKGKISRKDPSLAMCLNASCFTHSAHMVLIFYENTITPLLEKGDKTKVLAQDKDHLLKRLIDTLSTIYSMCIHYPTLNGKIHSIITATCRHITSDLALAKQIIRAETTALKKTKGGADDRTKRRRLRELYDGLQDRIAECDALGRLLALFIRSNAQGKTKSAKGRSQNVLPKKLQQLTQLTEKFHLGIKHLASTYENLRKTAKLILDRNRSSSSSSDEDEDEDETGSSILKPIAALDKLATSEIEALVSDSGEEDESPEHTGADEYSDGNDNDVVARKPKASATGTTAAATKSRVTRKRPRLRSSNAFIDEHLGEISDDDMDTYADLEDFIVTNDDDIE